MTNLSTIGYKVESLDDLKKIVPSAFADGHDPKRSDRYSFLSTETLVRSIMDNGWDLDSAKQNGNSPYSRHVIRFKNDSLGLINVKGDSLRPQIILDNSHNGTSYAQFHMGVFRLICTNGLVVALPSMYSNMKIRHMGADTMEIKRILEETSEHYVNVGQNIRNMQDVILTDDQREEFAIKAVAYREPHLFINDDGTINYTKLTNSTATRDILAPMRTEDVGNDLWRTFNVIQEHTVKGGYERRSENGRRSTTKGMTNATRNVKFNKTLWELAESYM
jgi:hypothetical protein